MLLNIDIAHRYTLFLTTSLVKETSTHKASHMQMWEPKEMKSPKLEGRRKGDRYVTHIDKQHMHHTEEE